MAQNTLATSVEMDLQISEVKDILNGCIAPHHKNEDFMAKIMNAQTESDAIDFFVSDAGTFPHLIYSSRLSAIAPYLEKGHFEKIIGNIGQYEEEPKIISGILDVVLDKGSSEICEQLWKKIEDKSDIIKNPRVIKLAAEVFGDNALSVIMNKAGMVESNN